MSLYKVVFILLFVIVNSCGESSRREVSDINKIQIEFDGGAMEFYKKHDLFVDSSDKEIIEEIFRLKELSVAVNGYRSLRPVMWQIDFYIDNKEDGQLLLRINSDTSGIITVIENNSFYENKVLFEYACTLIKFEEIKEYRGELVQQTYQTEILD